MGDSLPHSVEEMVFHLLYKAVPEESLHTLGFNTCQDTVDSWVPRPAFLPELQTFVSSSRPGVAI